MSEQALFVSISTGHHINEGAHYNKEKKKKQNQIVFIEHYTAVF